MDKNNPETNGISRRSLLRAAAVSGFTLIIEACAKGTSSGNSNPQASPSVATPTTLAVLQGPPLPPSVELVGTIPEQDPSLIPYTAEQLQRIQPQLEKILEDFPKDSVEYYMASLILRKPDTPPYAVLPNATQTKVILRGGLNNNGTTNASSSIKLLYDKEGYEVLVVSSLNVPWVEALSARRSNKSLAEPEWLYLFLKESTGNAYVYDELIKNPGAVIEPLAKQNMPKGADIPSNVHPDIEQLRDIRSWDQTLTEKQQAAWNAFVNEYIIFADILGSSYHSQYSSLAYPNYNLPSHKYGEPITPKLVNEVSRVAFQGIIRREYADIGLPNVAYALAGVTI